MPEAGSQPSQREKITISTMPSQNTGMLAPKSEATPDSRSSKEWARVADAMPGAMPPRVERRIALPVISMVALKRSRTSPSTGRFIHSERPRSPRATWLIQVTYWTWSGWSSPSWVRRRARSSLLALAPSITSAGSPGARCSTRNTISDTPSSTGPRCRSRRARKGPTESSALPLPEADRLHPEIEARVQLEALHALRGRRDLDLVVHEHPRGVLDQDALGLAVQRGALGLVGDLTRLAEEGIELLVLVHGAVRPVGRPLARVEERVHHHVRVLGAGGPREREQILFLGAELGDVRAPLHGLERDVHPHRAEVRLHDDSHGHRRLHAGAGLRHPHGGGEAVRVTGLGEKLLGLGGIVGIGGEIGIGAPGAGQNRPARDGPGALEHILDDGVLVHRVVQRLAHALVVQRLLGVVDAEVPDMRAHLLEEVGLRARLELRHEVRGHAHDEVQGAGEELGEARLVLHDGPEDDTVELHRALPVLGELLQHHRLPARP